MTIVIDSGVLIAFGLPDEPLHPQAKTIVVSWLGSRTELIAPRLLRSELTSVIRKVVYQNRIKYDEGLRVLSRLFLHPIELIEDEELLKSAYELAARFNQPRAYDSQYLALAERYDCDFWTADEKLVNSIQDRFTRIHWLGNFKS